MQWRCRGFGVAADFRQSIHGLCLVKEVAGWTTAIAGGCTLVVRVCWGDGCHKRIDLVTESAE